MYYVKNHSIFLLCTFRFVQQIAYEIRCATVFPIKVSWYFISSLLLCSLGYFIPNNCTYNNGAGLQHPITNKSIDPQKSIIIKINLLSLFQTICPDTCATFHHTDIKLINFRFDGIFCAIFLFVILSPPGVTASEQRGGRHNSWPSDPPGVMVWG